MIGFSRFGFKSGICILIAPVPVHCFSITFLTLAVVSGNVKRMLEKVAIIISIWIFFLYFIDILYLVIH